MLARGYDENDILGFYVLRYLPQAIREREIDDAADERLEGLVKRQLERNRQRLAIESPGLQTFGQWRNWYLTSQGKPIGRDFDPEETGPSIDGRFRSNAIAAAIGKARDAHLHTMIVDHLNKRQSVLVVFGGSHLMLQRPALDAALGKPCYVGATLARAKEKCR